MRNRDRKEVGKLDNDGGLMNDTKGETKWEAHKVVEAVAKSVKA